MNKPVFWLTLAGIICLTVFLQIRFPYALQDMDSRIQWLSIVGILVYLMLGQYSRKIKTGKILRFTLIWGIIALVLVVVYSFRNDLTVLKTRVSQELFPHQGTLQGNQFRIPRSNNGHFMVEGYIQSEPVLFMVDTGASDIVLTLHDARRVGISIEDLTFNQRVQTAKGTDFTASIRLPHIKVGGFDFYDIAATVSRSNMGTSLLGMRFLNRFDHFSFQKDHLILSYSSRKS